MRVLILCPSRSGYSYTIQSTALEKGLLEKGCDARLALVHGPEETRAAILRSPSDLIIAVGNWTDYEPFVSIPRSMGLRVIPWFVSDDHVIKRHAEDFNSLGILATPSEHCKANFVRSGVSAEIVHVIPEAVDTDAWRPLSKKEEADFLALISTKDTNGGRPRLDVARAKADGVPVIYTSGGSPTNKGAQEVMRALATLQDLPWLYIMKTWSHQVLFKVATEELELAEELGISDRVKYVAGEFSAAFMRSLVGVCDIYAAPSRFEGFGLPLVEAQLCGKPVVTIDATSTRETVVDGVTGFHAKKTVLPDGTARADISDLAKHLRALIEDPSLRSKMGSAARERALSLYSPLAVAKQFLTLASLLADRRA